MKSSKGFTLIELIVVMAVFLFVIERLLEFSFYYPAPKKSFSRRPAFKPD